ncbi:MAG: AGE family epimerase/isomerase [Candidatus Eremiobacteraeota bacterium]|nr:AGE family epimerase/isomerase [Candidatus Eremiobacteraeota bacterium]
MNKTPRNHNPIDAARVAAARECIEQILTNAVIPFWTRNARDDIHGGYRLHHDLRGKCKGPAPKALVTQARTLWFFSRLLNTPYGTAEHLDLARRGFTFLMNRMHDADYGGFYWETSFDGTPTGSAKHLYGQAFALFAIAEYASVSRDGEAYDAARELFRLLETHGHDSQYGGYVECFQRDWAHPDEGNRFLPVSPPAKSMNTHLHLLESFTRYYELTQDQAAATRIMELIGILSSAVVRKQLGACTNAHNRDWSPAEERRFWRISFGHDIESGWLLLRAGRAIGVPIAPFVDLFRSFADYALEFGFDRRNGGFYHTGVANKRADDRRKVWWVQAEALLGMLELFRATGAAKYYDAFEKTLGWIARRQTDRRGGDWFAEIDRLGRARGDKAGPWKGPYHNGRALIECLDAGALPYLAREGAPAVSRNRPLGFRATTATKAQGDVTPSQHDE